MTCSRKPNYSPPPSHAGTPHFQHFCKMDRDAKPPEWVATAAAAAAAAATGVGGGVYGHVGSPHHQSTPPGSGSPGSGSPTHVFPNALLHHAPPQPQQHQQQQLHLHQLHPHLQQQQQQQQQPPVPPPSSASGAKDLSSSSSSKASGSASNFDAGKGPLPPLCAGCRLRIVDRFYLKAVEDKWHTSCLKCSECGVELENQNSCFQKGGQIYCKEDYKRIFVSKETNCVKCTTKIQGSELVMRVKEQMFHVNCFRCGSCNHLLRKGELFGMMHDSPHCQFHFELLFNNSVAAAAAAAAGQQHQQHHHHHQHPHGGLPGPHHHHHHHHHQPQQQLLLRHQGPPSYCPVDPMGHSPGEAGLEGYPNPQSVGSGGGGVGYHPPGFPPPPPPPPSTSASTSQQVPPGQVSGESSGVGIGPPGGWFSGPPPPLPLPLPLPPPQASGAPGEFGGMVDFSYDNNNEPRLKKQRGRKKRKVENFAAMNNYLEAAGGYPAGLDASGQGKTKRARTSFKHHQLRIMKAHFQINQNPDSRELKMLSQKTQLDKKVLQVWFQNARAKWRRTKAQDGSGGSGGNSSIPPAPNSSSSGLSGSEDVDMGGASPSSDCSGPLIPCC